MVVRSSGKFELATKKLNLKLINNITSNQIKFSYLGESGVLYVAIKFRQIITGDTLNPRLNGCSNPLLRHLRRSSQQVFHIPSYPAAAMDSDRRHSSRLIESIMFVTKVRMPYIHSMTEERRS